MVQHVSHISVICNQVDKSSFHTQEDKDIFSSSFLFSPSTAIATGTTAAVVFSHC